MRIARFTFRTEVSSCRNELKLVTVSIYNHIRQRSPRLVHTNRDQGSYFWCPCIVHEPSSQLVCTKLKCPAVFSWTLQIAKFGCCHDILSVVCLSVTQMYCDKTTEDRIERFSLKSSETPNHFSMARNPPNDKFSCGHYKLSNLRKLFKKTHRRWFVCAHQNYQKACTFTQTFDAILYLNKCSCAPILNFSPKSDGSTKGGISKPCIFGNY